MLQSLKWSKCCFQNSKWNYHQLSVLNWTIQLHIKKELFLWSASANFAYIDTLACLFYLKGWARCDDLEQQEICFKACVCEIEGGHIDISTSQMVLPILLEQQPTFKVGNSIIATPVEKDIKTHRQKTFRNIWYHGNIDIINIIMSYTSYKILQHDLYRLPYSAIK